MFAINRVLLLVIKQTACSAGGILETPKSPFFINQSLKMHRHDCTGRAGANDGPESISLFHHGSNSPFPRNGDAID